jgi:hypothetical protein
MELLTVHRVMIAASIAMCLVFALWAVVARPSDGGSKAHYAVAALAVVVACGLAAYLRHFIRRTRRRLP